MADMKRAAGIISDTDIALNFTPLALTRIVISHVFTVPCDHFTEDFAALHGLAHQAFVRNTDSVI